MILQIWKFLRNTIKRDEQFVLLSGSCILLGLVEDKLSLVPMKQGVLYNIPTGMWHTTIMEPVQR